MAYDLARLHELVRRELHADPRLSLSELSRRLGACRQTLEKAVRAETGKSFRDLRRELLASKASNLLAGGPYQIKEIAYVLGYKSPQAFARFVRTARGCSATQLRGKGARRPGA